MRGRVTAVLSILLLSLSLPAAAQCNWTPRYSGQFRTTALDVSVDNDFLWLATGYGVQLLQRSGTTVRPLHAVALPGSTRVVRANGSGLAYAGSGSRLYVLRRNAGRIEIVRFIETAGTIQDLEIHQGTDLFAATSKGAAHYQLVPADTPVKSGAIFATSSQNVAAIAISGANLYTADGDSSVEIFNISIPSLAQKTDQIDTFPAATAVHATSDNFLYVSDRFGQNTDVISGKTRLARLPFGATSFAPSAARVHFVAGPDRTLRAVDFNNLTQPAEIFETQLPPTDGSDNAIHAIARQVDTIYVAAGDIGLVILDATPLAKPYPLAGYTTSAMTSSVVAGDRAWLAGAAGVVSEQKIDPQGLSLATQRSWAAGDGALVHDFADAQLLTSAGAVATLWSLTPATPTVSRTVTFPAAIAKAVLRGGTIVALLADGRVFTAAESTPQAVTLPTMVSLARHGSSLALMQILDDGRTVIHHYAGGDLAMPARTITLTGAAIGNLALDAARAALFLFNGVNVVDLASGTATPIAGSNALYPTQLAFAGDDLLVLADRTLLVYDDARALSHALTLPANGVALGTAPPYAVVATTEGMVAALYLRAAPETLIATSSSFPAKLLVDGDRLYFFSRAGVDIHTTVSSDAPHYAGSIRIPNLVDAAAGGERIYTLSGGSVVTAYSRQGAAQTQVTINEGADTQPLGITFAGNAVWVSISKGCLTGACERKTLVLDPRTLAVADSFSGQVVDVTTSGTRAYVLTSLPDEVRVLSIADPLHPSGAASIPAPSSARSLAYANGTVYVLGDKVYAFSEASLTATGTFLTASSPTASHQIRIAGSCAVISGRSTNPELYALPAFTAASGFDVPSNVRGTVASTSRLLLLTEHSIEVWTTSADTPSRRRGVR